MYIHFLYDMSSPSLPHHDITNGMSVHLLHHIHAGTVTLATVYIYNINVHPCTLDACQALLPPINTD